MTGAELIEYRKELNLTTEDLAARLGIAPQELDAWEVAEVACDQYPMLLEHAMNAVEYDINGMTDEEFHALQERIEQVIGPREAGGER
jgi:transcriptional regulator with XRE-family HTH domain